MVEYASMVEVCGAIGREAADALVKAFGGQSVYVPGTVDEGSRLASAIGLDAARALSSHFGNFGTAFVVPMNHGARLAARRREIAERTARGESTSQIAAAMGLHTRTVEKARARDRLTDAAPRSSTKRSRP